VTARLVAVRFEVDDPRAAGAFWAGLLGRIAVPEAEGVLVPGTPTQAGLRFVRERSAGGERNRLHLHVTSTTEEDQRRTVEAALALGGRRRGSGPLPFGRDLYLADPGGNEFCVIEPGNGYLAGTGLLGEVTCEGSPAAGRFWRDALGWEVVWDQEQQLVVQSPTGGTKLAWDGRSWPEEPWWNRQRFDLAADDPAAEAARLVGLGATVVDGRGDVLVLTDPDGSELSLSRDPGAGPGPA
jgi:catechol 2,3-dioxygenase-like lactoylglutathione lyase family enzyme